MIIAILDTISTVGFLLALIFIIKIKDRFLNSYIKTLFGLAMGLYVFIGLSNVLEHLNITDALDNFEDYSEILFVPILLFALHITKTENEIKKRKQVETSLKESEQKFRVLFDESYQYTGMLDTDGTMVASNQASLAIIGYDEKDVLGKPFWQLPWWSHSTNEQEKLRLALKKAAQGEFVRYETTHWSQDGSLVNVDFSLKPVKDEHDNVMLIIPEGRNITIFKQSEERLKLLSAAIEQAEESIIITDIRAEIQYVNPAFERTTGYNSLEVVGQNPRILKSESHDKLFYRNMWNKLMSGQTWQGHLINKKKDASLFEEDATITPIKNAGGDIIHYVAVKRDVTKERNMEDQLRQSQKMESIGTLAGGIAHDFNNLLSAIIGFTELSIDEVEDKPKTHESLNQVLRAAYRAKTLVDQILTFSRFTSVNKVPTKVIPIVKEVCKFIRSSLPSTIEIKQKITSENDLILADPTQFHQVLMNLCTNAGHSMTKTGGVLEVRLEETDLNEDDFLSYTSLKAGPYLKLSVKDTGHGISKENLERIFEPYFTTKDPGEGTGLGLAVTHGIVKDYGGAIKVYSEEGQGTIFHVLFPLIKEAGEVSSSESFAPLHIGTETIMLVDDEEMLVDVGTKILERLGYRVTGFTNPQEALDIFKNSKDSYDLIITDKTMPKMTGLDLATEIKKIRPDIPVLLCTGFQDRGIDDKLLKVGISEYVMKPLNRREMSVAVRKVLDKKTS